MRKSDDVQDERYVTITWMRKSDDVQDERYVTITWMRKSDDVQPLASPLVQYEKNHTDDMI